MGQGLRAGTSPSPGSPLPGQSLLLPPLHPMPGAHVLHAALFLVRATPKGTGGRIAMFILCNPVCPLTSVNHPFDR